MACMTWEQAIAYAFAASRRDGCRYRVYKSRAVVGWWNVVQIWW